MTATYRSLNAACSNGIPIYPGAIAIHDNRKSILGQHLSYGFDTANFLSNDCHLSKHEALYPHAACTFPYGRPEVMLAIAGAHQIQSYLAQNFVK
jgi:hypothetical protein